MSYREIPLGSAACTECDEIVLQRMERRIGVRPSIRVHGPRGARCPGSRKPGRPWLEASGLPTWGEMTDLDRGAALLHVWKRKREGGIYAQENYPARYINNEDLRGLDDRTACRHAAAVCGRHDDVHARLGVEEYDRLYDLALTEGQKIIESRWLWGARSEHGKLIACETEDHARFLVMNPRARWAELLHREVPGGEWQVMFDARGLEQDSEVKWVRVGDQVLWDGQWATITVIDVADPGPEQAAKKTVLMRVGGVVYESPQGFMVDHWEETVRIRRRSTVPAGAPL